MNIKKIFIVFIVISSLNLFILKNQSFSAITGMSTEEIEVYNNQYLQYKGNRKGYEILSLFSRIASNNQYSDLEMITKLELDLESENYNNIVILKNSNDIDDVKALIDSKKDYYVSLKYGKIPPHNQWGLIISKVVVSENKNDETLNSTLDLHIKEIIKQTKNNEKLELEYNNLQAASDFLAIIIVIGGIILVGILIKNRRKKQKNIIIDLGKNIEGNKKYEELKKLKKTSKKMVIITVVLTILTLFEIILPILAFKLAEMNAV